MTTSRSRARARVCPLFAALILIGGCRSDVPTAAAPSPVQDIGSGLTAVATPPCQGTCVLFDNPGPLMSALAMPDSLDSPVVLGELTLRGQAGDSVALQLTADSTVLAALTADEMVTVAADTVRRSYSLRDAASSIIVYHFDSAGAATLRYTLNRRLATAPRGAVRLVQRSGAAILAATTPWVRSPLARDASMLAASALADSGNPACDTEVRIFENGTYCGANIHFIQAVPADAFEGAGAAFQSDPGHGVSHPITITFDKPAAEVTVTIYDPTWDGNTMAAYDSAGNGIGFVAFPGNHTPGTLTKQDGHVEGAISRIDLTPAPGDYVAYSMTVRFVGRQRVQITSARTGLLEPTTLAVQKRDTCTLKYYPSPRRFTVKVLSDSGTPLPNRTVTLALTAIDNTGGHFHTGNKPVGWFAGPDDVTTTTVTTDATGSTSVTLVASEYAGQYILTGKSDGARDGVDTVAVGLPLEELGPGAHYRLVGTGRDTHPDAYYVTPTTITLLQELADSVYANFDNFRLGYNDMSLPLGGRFDYRGDWNFPHCDHRLGRGVDLRTYDLSPAETVYVKWLWPRLHHTNGIHKESNHWHLKTAR